MTLRLYHRTSHAAAIMLNGFLDATGRYMTDREWTGVWVSDVALDLHAGAFGEEVIEVIASEELIRDFEWVEEGKPHREWLVPAKLLNAFPRRLLTESEVDEAT